jgi:hypothetical protein
VQTISGTVNKGGAAQSTLVVNVCVNCTLKVTFICRENSPEAVRVIVGMGNLKPIKIPAIDNDSVVRISGTGIGLGSMLILPTETSCVNKDIGT